MMPHLYDIYKTEKDILFQMNLYGGTIYNILFLQTVLKAQVTYNPDGIRNYITNRLILF